MLKRIPHDSFDMTTPGDNGCTYTMPAIPDVALAIPQEDDDFFFHSFLCQNMPVAMKLLQLVHPEFVLEPLAPCVGAIHQMSEQVQAQFLNVRPVGPMGLA